MKKHQKYIVVEKICSDCGAKFTIGKYKSLRKGYIPRCKACRNLQISKRKTEYWKNLTDEERELDRKNKSIRSKESLSKMSPEKKKEMMEHRAHTIKTRSDERRKEISANMRKRFERMTDEEREVYRKRCREIWKRPGYIDKKIRRLKERYKNMTKEEWEHIRKINQERSQKRWDSYNEEEREYHKELLRKNYNKWAEEVGASRVSEINREINRNRWNNISVKDFHEQCLHRAVEMNRTYDFITVNKAEEMFLELISSLALDFKFQYSNIQKHPYFDKLFNVNPTTNSRFINPYHAWDFAIFKDVKTILVDIDGSIHFMPERTFMARGIDVGENIKFNDSQRKYQMDYDEGYIVKCPLNIIFPHSEVESLKDGRVFPFDEWAQNILI